MDRIKRVEAGGPSIANEDVANSVIDACNAFGSLQVQPEEVVESFSVSGDTAILNLETVRVPVVLDNGTTAYVQLVGADDSGGDEVTPKDRILSALGLTKRTFRATEIVGGVATATTVQVYVDNETPST